MLIIKNNSIILTVQFLIFAKNMQHLNKAAWCISVCTLFDILQ
jgi:hypothetical protein